MSGDRSGGRNLVPNSPFSGVRSWLFASQLRLQLFVVLVLVLTTVGIAVGTLVLLGGLPSDQPTEADGGTPTPTPTASPTPTPTPTPTSTPEPTPRNVVGDYRAATVVGTTTGGYVTVQFADGSVRQLPLAAVDVPGAGGADPAAFGGVLTGEAGRACLGTYGTRAAVAIESRLDGERVGARVVNDGTIPGGVGLSVRHGGEVVNRALVRQGFARATTDAYTSEMVDAREGEQGLWECGTVEPMAADTDIPTAVEISPPEAADEGGLRVVQIRPNPPDDASLSAETVTLRNTGVTAVHLDGWRLGDADGTRRGFADLGRAEDRRLQPGERVVLHTGSGESGDGHLYLSQPHQLWNDDGDVVRLVGPNHRRSVTVRYGSAVSDDSTDPQSLRDP